jgi:hypothetical protein
VSSPPPLLTLCSHVRFLVCRPFSSSRDSSLFVRELTTTRLLPVCCLPVCCLLSAVCLTCALCVICVATHSIAFAGWSLWLGAVLPAERWREQCVLQLNILITYTHTHIPYTWSAPRPAFCCRNVSNTCRFATRNCLLLLPLLPPPPPPLLLLVPPAASCCCCCGLWRSTGGYW